MLRCVTERLEVDLASLLRAADVVGRLGDVVAELPAETALRRVADALPGSLLSEAGRTQAGQCRQDCEALRALLDEHARGLREAATTYRRTDDDAAGAVPTTA
jgi:hypothetical protein